MFEITDDLMVEISGKLKNTFLIWCKGRDAVWKVFSYIFKRIINNFELWKLRLQLRFKCASLFTKYGGITSWITIIIGKIFFDAHAPHYMKNGFTKNTIAEIDFIIDILNLSNGSTILDVGCGTGRHAIELAKRGYKVTGVDISSGMLAEAKKAAFNADVNVEWIQSDAVKFNSNKSFDAVICLCEGA